jgi:hypothetical protein
MLSQAGITATNEGPGYIPRSFSKNHRLYIISQVARPSAGMKYAFHDAKLDFTLSMKYNDLENQPICSWLVQLGRVFLCLTTRR